MACCIRIPFLTIAPVKLKYKATEILLHSVLPARDFQRSQELNGRSSCILPNIGSCPLPAEHLRSLREVNQIVQDPRATD